MLKGIVSIEASDGRAMCVISYTLAKGICVGFQTSYEFAEATVMGSEDAVLVMDAAKRFHVGFPIYSATLEAEGK